MQRELLAVVAVLSLQMPSVSVTVLEVPSRQFASIQEAIDAAPDGAVIRIRPGVYRVVEPLWIRNKTLTLVGAGADGPNRTELLGPLPTAGDEIADPERARGVVNLLNSNVEMRDVRMRGFDAGVVARESADAANRLLTSRFRNIAIRDSGRGFLWKARGKLAVSDTSISDVAWNGISLAPPLVTGKVGSLLQFTLEAITIADFGNAGIVYINDPGVCDGNHTVKNASLIGGGGPAVLAIRSGVCIVDSYIAIPRVAAIVALSAAVHVENTKIFFPVPSLDGEWGTGVIASALSSGHSVVSLVGNEIKNAERNFITNLGSQVLFTGNELVCREKFDIEAGSFMGFPFSFNDGGNPAQCSDECPAQVGLPPLSFRLCKADPVGPPGPPEPAQPIE
jgi:hypothetical protein